MEQNIFLVLLGVLSFMLCMCVGGFFAWVCGFDLNEPEYYEHKRNNMGDK